jgi:hypothetical protein
MIREEGREGRRERSYKREEEERLSYFREEEGKE